MSPCKPAEPSAVDAVLKIQLVIRRTTLYNNVEELLRQQPQLLRESLCLQCSAPGTVSRCRTVPRLSHKITSIGTVPQQKTTSRNAS